MSNNKWVKVIYAFECEPWLMCDEPICPVCNVHYAECDCPGPDQEDKFEYKTIKGEEMARRKL